jgi:predicted DNA-binding transcriptional regulator AlpA
MTDHTHSHRRILRLKQVQDLTGLSRSTIYPSHSTGEIPQDGFTRSPRCRLARIRGRRMA